LQNAIGPLRDPISSALSARSTGYSGAALMTAVLEPRGSATSKIRSFGRRKSTRRAACRSGAGPRLGRLGFGNIWIARLGGVGSLRDRGVVLMATAILLAVVGVIVVRTKRAMYLRCRSK